MMWYTKMKFILVRNTELDYYVSIIELFSSQPTRQGLPFLPNSPAHPRGGAGREQAAVWYLVASWG